MEHVIVLDSLAAIAADYREYTVNLAALWQPSVPYQGGGRSKKRSKVASDDKDSELLSALAEAVLVAKVTTGTARCKEDEVLPPDLPRVGSDLYRSTCTAVFLLGSATARFSVVVFPQGSGTPPPPT
jgi:hypothetical protein